MRRNNKTSRFNVARDNKINFFICKKPDHAPENFYHLVKAQEAVWNNQKPIIVIENQQHSYKYRKIKNNNNNFARKNYPNKIFSRNRNNNYNNNNFAK